MPYAPIYAASKAGCCNLVRSLKVPLGKRGIRISAVCPEPVDTPLVSCPLPWGLVMTAQRSTHKRRQMCAVQA